MNSWRKPFYWNPDSVYSIKWHGRGRGLELHWGSHKPDYQCSCGNAIFGVASLRLNTYCTQVCGPIYIENTWKGAYDPQSYSMIHHDIPTIKQMNCGHIVDIKSSFMFISFSKYHFLCTTTSIRILKHTSDIFRVHNITTFAWLVDTQCRKTPVATCRTWGLLHPSFDTIRLRQRAWPSRTQVGSSFI